MTDLSPAAALDVIEALAWEASPGLTGSEVAERLRNRAAACRDSDDQVADVFEAVALRMVAA